MTCSQTSELQLTMMIRSGIRYHIYISIYLYIYIYNLSCLDLEGDASPWTLLGTPGQN